MNGKSTRTKQGGKRETWDKQDGERMLMMVQIGGKEQTGDNPLGLDQTGRWGFEDDGEGGAQGGGEGGKKEGGGHLGL